MVDVFVASVGYMTQVIHCGNISVPKISDSVRLEFDLRLGFWDDFYPKRVSPHDDIHNL